MKIINKIIADGSAENIFLEELQKRSGETDKQVTQTVLSIIEDVRLNGDKAVSDYTLKFDGVSPNYYEVPLDVIQEALTQADESLTNALLNAMGNITKFHEKQLEQGFTSFNENGVILGQTARGLERVGLYIPGGTAPYISSVLMCTIPAKIAGVKEVIMVTPPQKDGGANKDVLTAAAICGVDRVFLMGGAQAAAALAYGTQSVPKVDKIVGPGNIYVATAKKLLYGVVDIDMVAGPSEILIIADDSASPRFLAADLLSQAEHDTLSSSILITTSERIADETTAELERQLNLLPRKEIAQKALERVGAVIVTKTLERAFELSNILAPEHLELMIENPMERLGMVENAGSIFLGRYSPEPLGDYYAGPNHVLPTAGTARFFSPLSVNSFTKRSQYIYYSEQALREAKDDIVLIAEREGFTAHANALRARFEG
ncbi:MAG: histidinol dehydrogenase [Oscillospiraceae bacterium]|nr:histidinol dehydrogenase [Oscillospiraceae bacterium]